MTPVLNSFPSNNSLNVVIIQFSLIATLNIVCIAIVLRGCIMSPSTVWHVIKLLMKDSLYLQMASKRVNTLNLSNMK